MNTSAAKRLSSPPSRLADKADRSTASGDLGREETRDRGEKESKEREEKEEKEEKEGDEDNRPDADQVWSKEGPITEDITR